MSGHPKLLSLLVLCCMAVAFGQDATCTLSNTEIPTCSAAAASNQRVRREIKTLSMEEWQKVVDAIWIMKNTNMADGQSTYGSGFKPYDYFVVQHAVATQDSRGDQGHFSNGFATFHGAFVLAFEVALLAVDESIGALPYWDSTGDILTDTYFGSPTGTGGESVVIDGKFANFPVDDSFAIADWSSYMTSVDGATNGFSGNGNFLRGTNPNNPLTTSKVTRYGRTWSFATGAQDACTTSGSCWNDWYSCVEGGSSAGNFHSGAHQTIGGKSGSNRADFEDPTTLPNDPIFMFHHANVDRNRMKWMEAHAHERSVYYGFSLQCFGPLRRNCPASGLGLGDVINAQWPFSSAELGLSSLTSGAVTHAELLCYVGPATSPYTYAEPGSSNTSPTASASSSPASATTPVPSTVAPGTANDAADCYHIKLQWLIGTVLTLCTF